MKLKRSVTFFMNMEYKVNLKLAATNIGDEMAEIRDLYKKF